MSRRLLLRRAMSKSVTTAAGQCPPLRWDLHAAAALARVRRYWRNVAGND
jgi:hypothetical protein